MDIACTLTVYFDDPFWQGVYERRTKKGLEVAKVTFGMEPKDYEIYGYFLSNWHRLRFSPPVPVKTEEPLCRINPKRMQRAVHRQLGQTGVGTKAQQALKLQHEQAVIGRKAVCRERKAQKAEQSFLLRQQKKKEKHKGR